MFIMFIYVFILICYSTKLLTDLHAVFGKWAELSGKGFLLILFTFRIGRLLNSKPNR